MKILRDRDDLDSKVKVCTYCSTILEYEDSDIQFDYTPWRRGVRDVYKYFKCPSCNKKNYVSRTTEGGTFDF